MNISNYGVNFDGRRIVHPGAFDKVDSSAMMVTAPGSLNLPVVMGEADAGEPGVLRWFSSAESAKEYLRGGDLYTSIDLLFHPSAEGNGGCNTVGVIVTNVTTKSTKSVGGTTLESKEYGEGGNRVQTKMENGTIAGSKRITIVRWDTEKQELFDNIGAVLKVTYTGALAYAACTVTVVGGKATSIETKTGAAVGSAVTDLLLDLTTPRFTTLTSVASYINSVQGYRAEIIGRSDSLLATSLDAVVSADIKIGSHLIAMKSSMENEINKYSELVSLSVTGALVNFPYTYLEGGLRGVSPASWSNYFSLLKYQFSDLLVVLSSDAVIQAEAATHIQQMELHNQKQMLFTGGALGEPVSAIKTRALSFNSSRVVIGYPGIVRTSDSGSAQILPSYFTGALIAGRVSGVEPSEPVTFDQVNVVGLEVDLIAGDPRVDDLIVSGVCTLERVPNGGIRIVQGITTYLTDNNTLEREISVRRGADDLSTRIRKVLEDTYTGKKGLKASFLAVRNTTIAELSSAVDAGDIIDFGQVLVRFEGTVVYVEYEVAGVEPMNFILVTSHFVPTSFEII
jgi:hypothetical protein